MLYRTCTTITSVDLAHYGESRAKDWVSVDCGTMSFDIKFIRRDQTQRRNGEACRASPTCFWPRLINLLYKKALTWFSIYHASSSDFKA